MNERDRTGSETVPSGGARDFLVSLLYSWRLSGREWAIVMAVWLSPSPIPARQVAKVLRQPYSHTKAVVRGLVKINMLTRTSGGLVIQGDARQWGPSATPRLPERPRDPPPKNRPAMSDEAREVVFRG